MFMNKRFSLRRELKTLPPILPRFAVSVPLSPPVLLLGGLQHDVPVPHPHQVSLLLRLVLGPARQMLELLVVILRDADPVKLVAALVSPGQTCERCLTRALILQSQLARFYDIF